MKCLRYLTGLHNNSNIQSSKFDCVTKQLTQNMSSFCQNVSNNSEDILNKSRSYISDSESLFDENVNEKYLNKLYSNCVTSTPRTDKSNTQSIEIKQVKDIFITYNELKSSNTSENQDIEFFNLTKTAQSSFATKKQLMYTKLESILDKENNNNKKIELIHQLLDILDKYGRGGENNSNIVSSPELDGAYNKESSNTIDCVDSVDVNVNNTTSKEDNVFAKPKKLPKKRKRKRKNEYFTFNRRISASKKSKSLPQQIIVSRICEAEKAEGNHRRFVDENKAENNDGNRILPSKLDSGCNYRYSSNQKDRGDIIDSGIDNTFVENVSDKSKVTDFKKPPKRKKNRRKKYGYCTYPIRVGKRPKSVSGKKNSSVHEGDKEINRDSRTGLLLGRHGNYNKENCTINTEDGSSVPNCGDFLDSAINNSIEEKKAPSDTSKTSNIPMTPKRLLREKIYKKKDEHLTRKRRIIRSKKSESLSKGNSKDKATNIDKQKNNSLRFSERIKSQVPNATNIDKQKNNSLRFSERIKSQIPKATNIDKQKNNSLRFSERIKSQIPKVRRSIFDMYIQVIGFVQNPPKTSKSPKLKRKRFSNGGGLHECDQSKKRKLYCAESWLSNIEDSSSN